MIQAVGFAMYEDVRVSTTGIDTPECWENVVGIEAEFYGGGYLIVVSASDSDDARNVRDRVHLRFAEPDGLRTFADMLVALVKRIDRIEARP